MFCNLLPGRDNRPLMSECSRLWLDDESILNYSFQTKQDTDRHMIEPLVLDCINKKPDHKVKMQYRNSAEEGEHAHYMCASPTCSRVPVVLWRYASFLLTSEPFCLQTESSLLSMTPLTDVSLTRRMR